MNNIDSQDNHDYGYILECDFRCPQGTVTYSLNGQVFFKDCITETHIHVKPFCKLILNSKSYPLYVIDEAGR